MQQNYYCITAAVATWLFSGRAFLSFPRTNKPGSTAQSDVTMLKGKSKPVLFSLQCGRVDDHHPRLLDRGSDKSYVHPSLWQSVLSPPQSSTHSPSEQESICGIAACVVVGVRCDDADTMRSDAKMRQLNNLEKKSPLLRVHVSDVEQKSVDLREVSLVLVATTP